MKNALNGILSKKQIFMSALFLAANNAMAGVPLPAGGQGSIFKMFTSLVQEFVDTVSGPVAYAGMLIAIISAYLAWVYAPKEGIVGTCMRIAAGGVVVLNVAAAMAMMQF